MKTTEGMGKVEWRLRGVIQIIVKIKKRDEVNKMNMTTLKQQGHPEATNICRAPRWMKLIQSQVQYS